MALYDLWQQYQQPGSLLGISPYTMNLPSIPNITSSPTSYMNDQGFRNWVSSHQDAFNNADPSVSMNTHYTNWLNNNNYLPEANKGSFGEQLWNGITDQFVQNPIGNTLGLAGGLFGLWNGFNQYKMQKQGLNMAKDAYNFQKQMALNNERRNQEQWDMLKRQRASSSL